MKFKNLQVEKLKFNDETRVFSGYASKFNEVDSYGDTVFRGAYKETLQNRERPIRMRWNHFGEIIGKWVSIEEDEKGLLVTGELTKGHSVADNVYASLKHGAIDGLSIGYWAVESVKNKTGGEDLHEIELIEISVVEEPADTHATISDIKSHITELKTLKEIETFIRDECKLSRTAAKALVSSIKNHQRDVGVIDCSKITLNI